METLADRRRLLSVLVAMGLPGRDVEVGFYICNRAVPPRVEWTAMIAVTHLPTLAPYRGGVPAVLIPAR